MKKFTTAAKVLLAGMTPPATCETVVRYADGGRVVLALGVRISVGRRGGVVALSDWSRAGELVAAGVLRLDPWNGPGLEGHDTYTLSENHQ